MIFIPASSLQLIWTSTAQSGVLRAPSAGCWLSLPHLIFNWLNFLCTELYNCSTPTFFLWVSQIALIQPIHGQGYLLIFLDQMHLLFTQVHFLFLTAWPGSICYIVINVLHLQIVLNEYKLQSYCYFDFQTNIVGKGMNPHLWVK